MDIMSYVDSAIEFSKDKIDKVLAFWNDLEDDRKRLLIGCIAATCLVIVVAGIAYGIGKAHGERLAFEEEDF